MKNKIETWVLLGLIVLLTTYIIFRQDKNINYTIPDIPTINSDDLTKIGYKDFELTKKDGEWFLPSGYKVSETSMNRINSALSGLKIIDMISQSKDYERFNLDQENILTIYTEDGELLKLNIGSTSATGNYTYIKFPDTDEVYSVRGDLNDYFTADPDDLRSKVVLNVEDGTDIQITKDGETRTLNETEFKDITAYINELQADSFKDVQRDEILLTLTINTKNSPKVLNIYQPQEGIYPATSTDVDFPFTLPEYIVNKLKEL